jgi:hypothetical protein
MIDTSDAGANYPILPNVSYAAAGNNKIIQPLPKE